jgi:hypothetical protein
MPEEAVVTTNGPTVEDATRRRTVTTLWRAGLSEPDIAKRVGTTVEAVLEDLEIDRTERARRLEADFDVRREIVQTDDWYQLLINVMERELRRLEATPGAATLAKIKCVGQVAALIDARQRFLAEAGLLKPGPSRRPRARRTPPKSRSDSMSSASSTKKTWSPTASASGCGRSPRWIRPPETRRGHELGGPRGGKQEKRKKVDRPEDAGRKSGVQSECVEAHPARPGRVAAGRG